MAVFGIPVSNETLEGLPRFQGKTIGALDRARVALKLKTADGKDMRALQYVEDLMEKCGTDVVTLCLIYNATGNTLEYAEHRDWSGFGNLGAGPHPVIIQNGQWGAFIHQQSQNSNNGSSAAIVYRGTNRNNITCDWMLSWRLRRNTLDNRVYTEVRERGYFTNRWDQVRNNLTQSNSVNRHELNGGLSFVTIGNFRYGICEAILTVTDANRDLAT